MEEYDVIVIGGGPAGLFSAINSANGSTKLLVLEKNAQPGRKLLISGAGQCNLTHGGDIKDFLKHYGDGGRFLKRGFYHFTNQDLIEFFKTRGLDFIQTSEGKVFPATMKAKDVLNVLLKECDAKDITFSYKQHVVGIERGEGGFRVSTKTAQYMCKYLVIATGGMSYPSTGSTGDGFDLAQELGHSIRPPMPALTPLYIEDYPFGDLSGISFQDIGVALWRQGKKIRNWTGDILFTHRGLSGPGILNNSRYIFPGDIVKLNFIPSKNEEEIHKGLMDLLQAHGKVLVKNVLKQYPIPERLMGRLMELTSISEEERCAHLDREKRNRLAEFLCAFPLRVKKLGDFNIAMITQGGISLKEVNPGTMESRLVPNLFFAGEVLDIDGDTGGYNLQAAFSTGWLAGQAIGQNANLY